MAIPDISDYLVYTVETCKLFFKDREQDILPEEVLEFSVGCDYDGDYHFPEFHMSVKVDRKTFFDLMAEKDTVTMNLKTGYYVWSPQSGEESDKGKLRIWFNDKFVIRMDDKHYDILLNQRDAADEQYRTLEDKDQDTSPHKEYVIELYIFKKRDLDTAYTVTNRVYTSTDKNTIVTHLLNQAGASKVLMSPLENSTLKEAVAMPYTLVYNLRYLASQYGLHSHGTLIFFDLDYLYILNKKPGCTAWRPGESGKVIFVVREDDDDKSFMGGSRLNPDDKTTYVNISPSNLSFKSFSTIDDLVRGGAVTSVNTKTATTSTVKNPQISNHHVKFLHNKYGNSLAMKAVEHQMKERDMVAYLSIADANIHWFRPNKDFKFNFLKPELNKILGGRYRILNIFMRFTNTGEFFRNESTLMFSKEV